MAYMAIRIKGHRYDTMYSEYSTGYKVFEMSAFCVCLRWTYTVYSTTVPWLCKSKINCSSVVVYSIQYIVHVKHAS